MTPPFLQPVHFKDIKTGPQRPRRAKSESSRPPKVRSGRKVRFEEDKGDNGTAELEDYGDESGIYDTLPNMGTDKNGKKKKGRSWSFR